MQIDLSGLRSVLLAMALVAAAGPAAGADENLASQFAALPKFGDGSISPDGQFLAITIPTEGFGRVAILRAANIAESPMGLRMPELAAEWIKWVSDERFIVGVRSLGLNQNYLDENVYRTFAVSRTELDPVVLLATTQDFIRYNDYNWIVTDFAPNDPEHVYMPAIAPPTLRGPQFGAYEEYTYNLYRVRLSDGGAAHFAAGTQETGRWFMDGEGNVVARIEISPARADRVMVPDGKDYRQIAFLNDSLQNRGEIVGVTDDRRALAVSARRNGGPLGLHPIDLATGEWGAPLFQREGQDMTEVLQDEHTMRVIGASYHDGHTRDVYFLPQRQELQDRIEAALPNSAVRIRSVSTDGVIALIEISSAGDPRSFAIFDGRTNRLNGIGSTYPQLAGLLGETRMFDYTASDGVPLRGVLITPPGREARNLPLIAITNGGSGFSDGNFDWMAQYLASQGYAVLLAGTRENKWLGDVPGMDELTTWVTNSGSDVAGGIAALAAEGIVDSSRVCVFGRYLNAYLNLMTAVRDPGSYNCVISVSGYSDLAWLIRQQRWFQWLGANQFISSVVRHRRDYAEDELARNSPVNFAENAEGVFLILDAADRIDIYQSNAMVRALDGAGKTVESVIIEDEIGEFDSVANRTQMLTEISSFLARRIGN